MRRCDKTEAVGMCRCWSTGGHSIISIAGVEGVTKEVAAESCEVPMFRSCSLGAEGAAVTESGGTTWQKNGRHWGRQQRGRRLTALEGTISRGTAVGRAVMLLIPFTDSEVVRLAGMPGGENISNKLGLGVEDPDASLRVEGME
jgi:hypothetical protein